ncbi:hypothetical protein LJR118_000620 [Acidovorax sp. LjRoot118]|uniref:hypothetical protein n=1 Tax=Acidovorax sp. LjRoot118 TaxID=3342256 RepID=UPI003ECE86A5
MWHLQDRDGQAVVSGSGHVAWSAARGGWETPSTCYADPDHALVLVDLPADIASTLAGIDSDVDEIYRLAIGSRQAEYEEAERQAKAYEDAGYTGPVPPMVQCWADPKGWTAQQAADEILQQAGIWRGAQQAIRAQRLASKEQARAAESPAGLAAVRAGWDGFVAAVRAQLGVGGV